MTQPDDWTQDHTDELGDMAYSKIETELASAREYITGANAELTRIGVQNGKLLDKARYLQALADNRQAEIDKLHAQVKQLTTCDCGLPLSTGKCAHCDNDE